MTIPNWALVDVSKNFKAGEFLPPDAEEILKTDPSKWLLGSNGVWLRRVAQTLRNEFGPITINNWIFGGNRVASGLRLPSGVSNIGVKGSRHRLGLAIDAIPAKYTVAEVQQDLEKRQNFWLRAGVVRYEKTKNGEPISWVHVDGGKTVYGFNA